MIIVTYSTQGWLFQGICFFVTKTQPALQPSLQISSNRGSGENSAELLPTILYGWQADEAVIILACLIKACDVIVCVCFLFLFHFILFVLQFNSNARQVAHDTFFFCILKVDQEETIHVFDHLRSMRHCCYEHNFRNILAYIRSKISRWCSIGWMTFGDST